MIINSHIIQFKKGERVFNVGDAAHCAYIIESGIIGLYAKNKNDEQIASLGKGELLGEMGVIDDTNRAVSAYAETDLELLVIDREQITKRLENSDPIIRGVMEVLLRRIRNMLHDNTFDGKLSLKANNIVTEGMHKIRFEKELFRAIENNEIVTVYQPMVDLDNGSIAGFEALSRWNHPEKGMVSPFEFVTLAEESDVIITMGLKIFNSACEKLSAFQKRRNELASKLPPLFMSINVSAAQLISKDFLKKILAITKKHLIEPKYIKVEITESLVVDYQQVQGWIDECHTLGFKLSLDDFGTGYSGFQHLLELDFHTIKIDQTFVMSMKTNNKSLLMLEIICDMAKRMNMSIVAEGIEDLDSANLLSEMGVNYGQGYYFFKPMSSEKILEILR